MILTIQGNSELHGRIRIAGAPGRFQADGKLVICPKDRPALEPGERVDALLLGPVIEGTA
jgi:hypothetical protein